MGYQRTKLSDFDRVEWKAKYSLLSWTSKHFLVYFIGTVILIVLFSLLTPFTWPRPTTSEQIEDRIWSYIGVTVAALLVFTLVVTLRMFIDLRFGFKWIGTFVIKKVIDLNEYKLLILSNYELFLVKKSDRKLGAADVGFRLRIVRTATLKLVKSKLSLKKPAHNNVFMIMAGLIACLVVGVS